MTDHRTEHGSDAPAWRRSEMTIAEVEPALTAPQRMRLIEIAHETKDEAIREAALKELRRASVVCVERPGLTGLEVRGG